MSSESEKLIQHKRYKLMFKKTGPFRIVATDSQTATIDEDGLHNTISIDRISPATSTESKSAPPTNEPADESTPAEPAADTDEPTCSPSEEETREQQTNEESSALGQKHSETPAEPEQYVVERIVGHMGNRRNRRYVVRWYGY